MTFNYSLLCLYYVSIHTKFEKIGFKPKRYLRKSGFLNMKVTNNNNRFIICFMNDIYLYISYLFIQRKEGKNTACPKKKFIMISKKFYSVIFNHIFLNVQNSFLSKPHRTLFF